MSDVRDALDWEALARSVGSLRQDAPGAEAGGSAFARTALAMVLGVDELRRMVDWYVSFSPGFELVRSVLWLLHPWEAMDRCHELWASDADLETRRSAVELLRVVADGSVLPWIPAFLEDPDPAICDLAVQIVDQLVFADLVDASDAEEVLRRALDHREAAVRERAAEILDRLVPAG